MRVAVIGTGIAGSAAGLAFARAGNEVTVCDRVDPPADGWSADEIFERWQSPWIGQFRQPHNFLGLGRAVLREELPDVYSGLRACGATEVDQTSFLSDADPEPGDEDLATIACRRPIFDAALRRALIAQPGITLQVAEVTGLRARARASGVHVTGAVLRTGETLDTDLVVDGSGRASRAATWLADGGAVIPRTASTECGLLYYSRHYRVREDAPMPGYASLLGGPRGDLGYLAYAVFIGDNRTFCLCIMPPVWDRPFRQLRDEAAFQRVATLLPGMAGWLDVSEPASSVFAMGQLRNTLNTALDIDSPAVTGFVSIGDARCHTNPTFAFGASLSLWQAVRLASLAGSAADDRDLVRSFEAEVALDAAERFAAVSAEDAERARHWSGEPIDPADPQACPALFLRHVVYRVAVGDGELLRIVARRINALDPVNRLGQRTDLLERALARYQEMQPSLPPAPPRSQLLAALNT